MSMNNEGWVTRPETTTGTETVETFTGNRALMLEEALIFEQADYGRTGVDFAEAPKVASRLGGLERNRPIGLPGLPEPEAVRHYTRLSRQNYAIDLGLFPLGSCTMKHNPRLNEKVARLPGFADIHPLAPVDTVQGAFAVIHQLGEWLKTLTGMPAVAMAPKAGAHGELCGLLAIRAALEARGDARSVILVPESAHGTNPATAAFCGYAVENIPATAEGRVDLAALQARLGPDVAAVMITNPNTCGLFERDMRTISDAVHAAGALVYCDGANFNAIVGRVRPGDLGIDAMHINLHKTFSTPHGGGGPGSGPVVFSEALAPFAPLPFVEKQGDAYVLSRKRPPATIMRRASAGWRRSTARWACSPARLLTSSATAPTACARSPRMRFSTPTISCAVSTTCSMRHSASRGRACTRRCSATTASPRASPPSISPRD
jgi:glycine dehydrogenase subunit 2